MTRASFEEPGPGAFEERDSKTPAEASAEEVHAYLGRVRSLVESKLDEVVPAEGAEPSSVHAAMRWSLFAPAKRLRPVHLFEIEEHTSELQSQSNLVCRLLLEKKKKHEKA